MNNSEWSFWIIDQLAQQGVRHVCIAPGSRSSALALAAARHPKIEISVHFDERGLGFYALGLALRKPVAIIVTSGTAVGNLLPAVMEADQSHTGLILLTADRPHELRDCGANQTIDQIKLFSNYVRWQTDLACPDASLERYVRSTLAYATSRALEGPVHINCPFREPLYAPPESFREGAMQEYVPPCLAIHPETAERCSQRLNQIKKGIILIGRGSHDLKPIFHLAKTLRWPIFTDLLSQARCQAPPPELIENFDYVLQTKDFPEPEFILYFGDRFTSKWVRESSNKLHAPQLHVHDRVQRFDPSQIGPARIIADPSAFCHSLTLETQTPNGWLEEWTERNQMVQECIDDAFSSHFTEAHLMRELGRHFPENGSLFLGNSMPIRDAEHFFFPGRCKSIFCNRGVSGIDGQIATAAGIATILQSPICALIGDQSCLHDLNSLSLIARLQTPFLLIVSNNFGGGIFSHLPVAEEKEHFEHVMAAAHDLHFEHAAKMFGIPYRRFEDATGIREALQTRGPMMIEVVSSRAESTIFQKKLVRRIQDRSLVAQS